MLRKKEVAAFAPAAMVGLNRLTGKRHLAEKVKVA
jgi:hypothetical protein